MDNEKSDLYLHKKITRHDPENEKNESHGQDDPPIRSCLVRTEKKKTRKEINSGSILVTQVSSRSRCCRTCLMD